MCLYPKLIRNPKYKANKKNGGVIPPVFDERVTRVPIGCTECLECRKQKAVEWRTRMLEDIKTNKNGIMVTLTFSDEKYSELANECGDKQGYILDNIIATRATRKFLEDWRGLKRNGGKSLRHWLVTELGHNGTENIHLHGIVWTNEPSERINEVWKNGYTYIGDYVNESTVNYIIKYVTKIDLIHKEYKPIILSSKGIGKNYTETTNARGNQYRPGETKESYTTRTGDKTALPMYYRNKIYTEEEREKLWIEKLDKEERWVMGRKIDVSKNEKEYWAALDEARERNKRLGYGDGVKNWEREQYEREQRIIKQQTRIERAKKRNI